MNAVGAVGRAGRDLVQKHDVTLPFLDPHRVAGERRQFRGERGQFMVMRREKGAAAIDLVQMLERCPGDREAVEGRGAAADLVEDDKAPGPGLVQDRRGLDHLDHKGRAAARQIVGGANPAEQAVDDADPRRARRHKGADLCQDRDEGVLPQKRALAGHVGAGHEPDAVLAQNAVIGDKGACSGERRFDDRMPPAADLEPGAAIDVRPHPIAVDGAFGMRRREIQGGERGGRGGDLLPPRHDLADEILEEPQFQRERALGGAGDLAFELAEFDRRVAHRARHRLAVHKIGAELASELFYIRGRHLDVIADDVVVADAQRGDADRLGIARLQRRDRTPAVIAQFAQLIELGGVTRRDKAAVARKER